MPSLKLPTSAGVILLAETTLFPYGALPLHIFEPRYRQMLNDALERDFFFCVGTLESEETSDPAECTAKIGTIGLIRASRELPDGRSELLLHGICRVNFTRWHQDHPYPYADIEPFHSVDLSEHEEAVGMERLRGAVTNVLDRLPDDVGEAITSTLDKINDAFTATDAVAHQFVSDPTHRKALLEEPSVAKRLDIVIEHFNQLEA